MNKSLVLAPFSVTMRVKLLLSGYDVRSIEELLLLFIPLYILFLFLQAQWDHLICCWWLHTCIWDLWGNTAHQGDCDDDYWGIIPKGWSLLLSRGPHEPNQLVSSKSRNVPDVVPICFSQVACLLISCIWVFTTPEVLIQVQQEVLAMAQTPCSANK